MFGSRTRQLMIKNVKSRVSEVVDLPFFFLPPAVLSPPFLLARVVLASFGMFAVLRLFWVGG